MMHSFFSKSRAVLLNDQLHEQRWMDEEDILKTTQVKKEILPLKENWIQHHRRQVNMELPESVISQQN